METDCCFTSKLKNNSNIKEDELNENFLSVIKIDNSVY